MTGNFFRLHSGFLAILMAVFRLNLHQLVCYWVYYPLVLEEKLIWCKWHGLLQARSFAVIQVSK